MNNMITFISNRTRTLTGCIRANRRACSAD